jgi:carbon-monoxide dehydrogenase small subunit
MNIKLQVNDQSFEVEVSPELLLVDLLRDRLGLTGTKVVCGEGECGACSIIMNGKLVNSCLILAVEAQGASIVTIEGVGTPKKLSPVQQSFIDDHAVQCGFCIPGMILTGEHILTSGERLDREHIKSRLAGNICRCTGYHKIVDAIAKVGEQME